MNVNSESGMFGPAAVLGESGISRKLRSHSPFRALVWKEWREQRFIWAALLALSLATEVAVRLAPARGDLREVLLLLIPFLWGSMATLLGANAFTGDRDTDTESFVGALPVSRRFRFWVKIGVLAGLLWTAQALTALCMPQTNWYWFKVDNSQPSYFMYYLLVSFSLGMILLSLTAACVASWASSTLSAVIQTALVGPCLLLWMAFMGKLFYAVRETGHSGDATARWSALATALLLAHVVMLVGAYRLWTAADGSLVRQIKRAASVVALFLLVLLAPSAAPYAKATLMAPAFPTGWKMIMPSPAGRYALIYFGWPQVPGYWQWNDRVVFLDTETSRTVRLSRLQASGVVGEAWSPEPDNRGTWSPDGTRFVFCTSNQWTSPSGVLSLFPPWATDGGNSWWVDVTSGQEHNFRSFPEWYSFGQYSWWWDDRTLAFHEGNGMVFQDIRTGDRRFCADKVPAKEVNTLNFFSAKSSATGIWFLSPAGDLHCYRPDATAALVLHVQMPVAVQGGFGLDAISPNGNWAIFRKWCRPGEEQQAMICSLETGVAEEIDPLDGKLLGGDIRESFTPDSKATLLCGRKGVGLWDVGKRKLDMLYSASPDSVLFLRESELSHAGNYLLVEKMKTSKFEFSCRETYVVDMATKRAWPVWKSESVLTLARWLGDDQLLVCQWKARDKFGELQDSSLWLISRDGTSKRKVLP